MKLICISTLLIVMGLSCIAQDQSKKDTLAFVPLAFTDICLDCPRKPFVTGDILINPYENSSYNFLWDSLPTEEEQLTVILSDSAAAANKMKLQGLWSAHWTEHIPTQGFADADYDYIYHSTDIYVEGDSIWTLDYPCERTAVYTFSPSSFLFINDSTVHYGNYRYSHSNYYDTTTLANLKANELNPECYAGEWNVVSTEGDGDGNGRIFIYPFSIDEKIVIKSDDLKQEVINVNIDGKKRAFLIRSISHSKLVLTPTESWLTQDNQMWDRSWDLPPPTKRELKNIKQTKGRNIVLTLSRL
jgi:hypothetical protein